jgi:hypothetical protein
VDDVLGSSTQPCGGKDERSRYKNVSGFHHVGVHLRRLEARDGRTVGG